MECHDMLHLLVLLIALDVSIHHTQLSNSWKAAFQDAIHDNPILHALAQMILEGWKEDMDNDPYALHAYWDTPQYPHCWGWHHPV